jgi:hypothetical protein
MKRKQVWMALVIEANAVVFNMPCPSKKKAERAVVDYLSKNRDFKGKEFAEACFWVAEKNLHLNLMVFQTRPDVFEDANRARALSIDPPPNEKGLFRVVYVIDVGAGNVVEAAMNAYKTMGDSQSMPPVVEVVDGKGNKIKIDLSQRKRKG